MLIYTDSYGSRRALDCGIPLLKTVIGRILRDSLCSISLSRRVLSNQIPSASIKILCAVELFRPNHPFVT